MDFATLVRFLVPALKAILPTIDPATPAGKIAQIVMTLLPMFGSQAAHLASLQSATHVFGTAPPVQLPPEERWSSPEALLEWAGSRPTTGAAPATGNPPA